MSKVSINTYTHFVLKFFAWFLGVFFALIILIVILVQVPSVQNYAKDKAVSWLHKKLNTNISVGKLLINFPNKISLEKVYIEDQHKDSLLWGDKLEVDIALLKLLKNTVAIKSVELNGIGINLKRINSDTVFNFAFILDTFTTDPKKEKAKTDSSKPMQFILGSINCKNISINYHDDVVGINSNFSLSNFQTTIKDLNLEKSIYDISTIAMNGLRLSLNRYKPLTHVYQSKETSSSQLPEIRTGKISLYNSTLIYTDAIEGLQTKVDSKKLLILIGKMELEHKQYTAKNILIDTTLICFDNNNSKAVKKGIDYQHFKIDNLGFSLDSLDVNALNYQGTLKDLHFKEKSGLDLKELSTRFFYSDQQARLESLILKTDKTVIKDRIALNYPSINSISKNPENILVDAKLVNSKLAVSDILLLVPVLDKTLVGQQKSILGINAQVNGYLKNLRIPILDLNGLGSTSIKLNGTIKGLPKADHLFADINIVQFVSSKKDITSILPKKTIPNFINIPEKIKLTGVFRGTMKEFATKLRANTSDGFAKVEAKMGNKKSFEANIQTDSLNLGKILRQEANFGKLSLHVIAKGKGFDYKTMQADINAELVDASVKGYHYKNLLLDMHLNNGEAAITSSIHDPNLSYQLVASGKFGNPFPSLTMDLNFDTINLQQINIVKERMAFHGRVLADIQNSNPDSLEGNMMVRNMHFTYQKKTFSTDSIILSARNEKSYQTLTLQSKPARVQLKGKYRLTELSTALKHTFNEYYQIPGYKDTAFVAQEWTADFHLNTSPLVLRFMPELEGTDTITASVKFNSRLNNLRMNLSAPLVQYSNQHIKKLKFEAFTTKDQIEYHLRLRQAGSPSFLINETSLDGNIKSNTVYGNLIFRDKKFEKNYQLAGFLKKLGSGIQFKLEPDSLLLYKQKWVVKETNQIRYDSTGVYARDFQFQFRDQAIALNSMGEFNGAPLKIEFKNFDINTITDIAKKDSLFADGIINGSAIVNSLTNHPSFTSDITIANLAYQRTVMGNLIMKVDNIGEDQFNANLELKGLHNQAILRGTYRIKEGSMNLHLLVDSLNMAILKPFTANQFKEATGNVKAAVEIDGSFDKPIMKGKLNFENVFMTSSMLGQKFKMDKDEVLVDETGVHFANFNLEDSLGNRATLDGDLLTNNFRGYDFNLKLHADDFNLINSTQADNQLFFGKLNMDADIKVTGNLEAPIVNAKFTANKNTDLTVVMPNSNPEIQSREGVVNFIDKKKINDTLTKIIINDSLVTHSAFSGLVLNTIIETDTAALFTMVIDSQTGDALSVKGKSSLSASLDESRKLSLTGLYELERGSYQFSLNMLKKNFEIVKGSTITWTGDPMSAIVDIKALYKLKASPIDLVEQQLVGQTPTEINKYKQRIPVEVYLKMKGDLLKPQIIFDVLIPDAEISKWPLVDEKLQKLRIDESEINKQVFALLILGRFVGEDITQNSTGSTTTGTMVRQSVSGILASQLNRVAGGLVKGVDLNFDFESQDDYSSGTAQTRTDLKVGMSRTLKNERIKVNVGTNVPLEGGSTAQNASFISSDVQVDYMLSKDGKYMLRTYSKNKYEGVVEGQIIETGVTFIFTVEYNKFKEMFRKSGATETGNKKGNKK